MLRTTRHYWGSWAEIYGGVSDPRKPELITYPLTSLLFTGTFMFITQLATRRGIADYLRENETVGEKMEAWFGVAETPHGDTLNYTYRRLVVAEVQEVVCRSVERLIRARALERYRLLGLYYTLAIDGTGITTFRERHCEHCLTKTLRNGETLYYHPVLEAKLVMANGFAFSLMTEFVENATPTESKQDCELKAFYRLAKRLKKRFPRLPLCLLLDGLFAGGPTFEICETYHWKYLIVLQEQDLPNVHRSFAAVKPHLPKQHKHVDVGDDQNRVQQYYRWAEALTYTDSRDHAHLLNLIECRETEFDSKLQSDKTTRYKWLTNFTLTTGNVDILANQGGRLRWKIENEGFNFQKNSDLNLEHAYSEDPIAQKVFYLLMQLACLFFQVMQHGSLLAHDFPDRLRTAKNLARRILEAWRNLALPTDEFLALGEGRFQIRFDSA